MAGAVLPDAELGIPQDPSELNKEEAQASPKSQSRTGGVSAAQELARLRAENARC